MLTARAADADREVATTSRRVIVDACGDEALQVIEHDADGGLLGEVIDDGRIATREGSQGDGPVGIRQRARIEDEIAIARHAVLETERDERDRQLRAATLIDALHDHVPQFVHAHVRRVDHEIGGLNHGIEQLALAGHGLLQTEAFAGERMPTLGFAEAAQQLGIGSDDDEQFASQATAS